MDLNFVLCARVYRTGFPSTSEYARVHLILTFKLFVIEHFFNVN